MHIGSLLTDADVRGTGAGSLRLAGVGARSLHCRARARALPPFNAAPRRGGLGRRLLPRLPARRVSTRAASDASHILAELGAPS